MGTLVDGDEDDARYRRLDLLVVDDGLVRIQGLEGVKVGYIDRLGLLLLLCFINNVRHYCEVSCIFGFFR